MANIYTVEKEINGKKYIGQYNGRRAQLRALDNSYVDDTDHISFEKMVDYILTHVIVEPKGLDMDDLSDDEFNEVVAFGRQVMNGELEPKSGKEPAKTKSTR